MNPDHIKTPDDMLAHLVGVYRADPKDHAAIVAAVETVLRAEVARCARIRAGLERDTECPPLTPEQLAKMRPWPEIQAERRLAREIVADLRGHHAPEVLEHVGRMLRSMPPAPAQTGAELLEALKPFRD